MVGDTTNKWANSEMAMIAAKDEQEYLENIMALPASRYFSSKREGVSSVGRKAIVKKGQGKSIRPTILAEILYFNGPCASAAKPGRSSRFLRQSAHPL